MRPRRPLAGLLVGLLLSGAAVSCSTGSSAPSPAPEGVGKDVGDIGHDLPIVKQAQAAAGDVVRSAGDCDAVKAGMPRAQAALDEASQQVRTGASRSTIANLRKQMQDIAGACP
ncbi:MAG: hypothetical protein ACHQNV_01325 [Vicinamibacteria bacterium]